MNSIIMDINLIHIFLFFLKVLNAQDHLYSLIAYYPLSNESQFKDLGIYSKHGQIYNLETPVNDITITTDQLDFTQDENMRIQTPNNPATNVLYDEISIVFWYKGPGNVDWGAIVSHEFEGSFQIYTYDYEIQVAFCENYIYDDIIIKDVLDDTWHHFIIQKKQEEVQMYLDGQFYNKFLVNCKIKSQGPMCFGSFCAGEFQLKGSLKEFRFYNKILEDHEIQIVYSYPNCPSFCPDCQILNGNFIKCESCLGDRIISGNICKCPTGYRDDYQSELCQLNYIENGLKMCLYSDFDIYGDGFITNIAVPGYNRVVTEDNGGWIDDVGYTTWYGYWGGYYTNYINNNGQLDFGTEDFSIGMWIFVDDEESYGQTIISGGSGTNLNFYIYPDDDDLEIRVGQQDIITIRNVIGRWTYFIVSKFEEISLSVAYDDYDVKYCFYCLDQGINFTMNLLNIAYFQNNQFAGYISHFKVWHKRKPQSSHEFYIEKHYDNYRLPSGGLSHSCPWECQTCEQYMGSFRCLTCRGDRSQIGIDCLCPQGTFDDQRSLNCRDVNYTSVYYSFDNGQIYDHSVTLFGEVDNINDDSNLLYKKRIQYTEDRFGQYNMAFNLVEPSSFSGNTYIKNYVSELFFYGYDDFTFSFWIKAEPTVQEYTDQQNGHIFHNGDITVQRYDTTNDIRFNMGQKLTNFILVPNVFNNEWQHVTIMRHSQQYLRAYVNGNLSVEDTLVDKFYISPVTRLEVGQFNGDKDFDGYLDELRFYKKQLDITHIQSLYSYPECPFYCQGEIGTACEIDKYEIKCIQCWGNRVKQGNYCICPQQLNQDYQEQEICINHEQFQTNSFLLYLSFDGVLEDAKNNTQIEKLQVISNNVEYTNDQYNIKKRALDLNRSNSIKIENKLITDYMVNDFTIMIQISAPEQGLAYGTIFYTSSTKGISIYRQGSTQHLGVQIYQSFFIIENVLNDQWNHLTLQYYDQQYVQIFINGIIRIQETYIGDQQDWNLNQQLIMGDNEKQNRKFNGYIDELRIYTEKLSIEKIQQIINYQCAFQCQKCDIQYEGLKCQKYDDDEFSLCRGDRKDGLYSDQGICVCPDYTFDDSINEYCQPCPNNCKQCNSLQDCTQCIDFESEISVRDQQNLCNCPFQNYYENGNIQCSKCNNDKCVLCQDDQSCSECVGSNQDNKDLRQLTRDCTCPDGYFDNSPNIDCIACEIKTTNCIECDKYNGLCTKCKGDLVFKEGVCKCDQNLYTSDLSNPFDTNCSACPENSSCPGGFEIVLNQGFWRNDQKSDKISECFNNPENCKGGQGDQYSQCIEGNIGPLCEDCDIKNIRGQGRFSHASEYTCGSCENVDNNILKIMGILLLQFITLYLSVTGTLSASKDLIRANCLKELFKTGEPQTEEKGVITKILLNYFYLISTILTFRIGIPYSFGSFGNPSKQMSYSMDCFLNEISGDLPLTYFRIIFSVIVALAQIILVLILVFVLIKFKQITDNFRSYLYTTVIYQFIATSPGIVSMVFEGMACRQILGTSYIVSNIQDECYTAEYNQYTFSVLVPILIVFCIFIPLIFFISLCRLNRSKKPIQSNQIGKSRQSKRRSSLAMLTNFQKDSNQQKNQEDNVLSNTVSLQKYGYLYLEYNNKAYYWEFVKIYQRYLIAIVLTFYYNEIYFKGIMIFFIVTIYSVLQYLKQPYKLQSQNKLDQETSVITAVSIILGLYMYENDSLFWFIIAAIVLIGINSYIVLQLLNKLLMAQAKTKFQKLSQKKQQQEQIQARDQIKKQLKVLGNQREQIEIKILNLDPQDIQQLNEYQQQKQDNINQVKASNLMMEQLEIFDDENDGTKKIIKKNKISKEKMVNIQEGFNKILEIVENIGVKYLGSHSSKAIFNAKKLKSKLKKRVQTFVRGIQYKIFVQNNQQNSQDEVKFFSIHSFLAGKITEQEILQIEKEIEIIEKIKIKNSYQILQKLQINISEMIFDNPKHFKQYIQLNQQQQQNKNKSYKNEQKLVQQKINYSFKKVIPINQEQNIEEQNLKNQNQKNNHIQCSIEQKHKKIELDYNEQGNQFLNSFKTLDTQKQLITQSQFIEETHNNNNMTNQDLQNQTLQKSNFYRKQNSIYQNQSQIFNKKQQQKQVINDQQNLNISFNQTQHFQDKFQKENKINSQMNLDINENENNNINIQNTDVEIINLDDSVNDKDQNLEIKNNFNIIENQNNEINEIQEFNFDEGVENKKNLNINSNDQIQKFENEDKNNDSSLLESIEEQQNIEKIENLEEIENQEKNQNLDEQTQNQQQKQDNSQNKDNKLQKIQRKQHFLMSNNSKINLLNYSEQIDSQDPKLQNSQNNENFQNPLNSQIYKQQVKVMSCSQSNDNSVFSTQSKQQQIKTKSQLEIRQYQYSQKFLTDFSENKLNNLKTIPGIEDIDIENLQEEYKLIKDFNIGQQEEQFQDVTSYNSQNMWKLDNQVKNYSQDIDIQDLIDIYERYQVLDESKDGNIEVSEFLKTANLLGLSVSKQDIESLFKLITKNHQQINFLEFATLLIFQRKEKNPVKELRQIFQYFKEKPENLYLTRTEIQLMINNILNVHVSKKQISALINQVSSIKSNNFIGFEDFVNLLN